MHKITAGCLTSFFCVCLRCEGHACMSSIFKVMVFLRNAYAQSITQTEDGKPVQSPLSFKPGFHMSGKSQMIRDFAVSQMSQILRTNENTNP